MAKNKTKYKSSIQDVVLIDEQIAKAHILKTQAIQSALTSGNVDEIYKAQKYLQQITPKDQNTKPQSFSIFCKSHWNHAALFSLSFLADSIFCEYLFTISAVARTAIFFGNKTFLA